MIPRGLYKVKEDEDREIEEEETPAQLTTDHCWKMSNWVHYTPSILLQGRVTREEPEFIDDFDDEDKQTEVKDKLIAKDPYEPRLSPITNDKRNLNRCQFDFLLER